MYIYLIQLLARLSFIYECCILLLGFPSGKKLSKEYIVLEACILRLILHGFQVNGNTVFMTGGFKEFKVEENHANNTWDEQNAMATTAVRSSSLCFNFVFRFSLMVFVQKDLFQLIFFRIILPVLTIQHRNIPVSSNYPTFPLHL